MSYAEGTSVPEAQSRIDIEKIIKRHVGREASFTFGSMAGKAAIGFTAYGRTVKVEIPMPTTEEAKAKAGRVTRMKLTRIKDKMLCIPHCEGRKPKLRYIGCDACEDLIAEERVVVAIVPKPERGQRAICKLGDLLRYKLGRR
jgi:hypothetical protein